MTKDEALRLALEALETELAVDMTNGAEVGEAAEKMCEAITAIKEALAQEQDCVGWFGYDTGLRLWFEANKGDDGAIPLYKDPPQRTWVGLTDEEVDQFHNWKDCTWSTNELVRYVEAKLKEKNHG
jgi:hypothetical protein